MRFVQNGLTKFKAQVYGLLHIGMVIISFQEILALEWCLLLSKLSTLSATTWYDHHFSFMKNFTKMEKIKIKIKIKMEYPVAKFSFFWKKFAKFENKNKIFTAFRFRFLFHGICVN